MKQVISGRYSLAPDMDGFLHVVLWLIFRNKHHRFHPLALYTFRESIFGGFRAPPLAALYGFDTVAVRATNFAFGGFGCV